MIFLAAGVVVQILCVMHILNTGRDRIWIWIVLLFSLLGCCAYFSFQVMPDLFGPGSRFARNTSVKANSDPVRLLRAAEARLSEVDSAATRVALAEAHFATGAYRESALQYRTALDRLNGRDALIEAKLGWALFEGGEFKEALDCVDRIPDPVSVGETDRLKFLRARILAELGRGNEACAIFEDIVTRLPGEEPRCRYAALLLEMNKRAEARSTLEAVEHQVKRHSNRASGSEAAMIDWAMDQLKSLRQFGASSVS